MIQMYRQIVSDINFANVMLLGIFFYTSAQDPNNTQCLEQQWNVGISRGGVFFSCS